ncbi:hypothetical protein EHP00_2021 [Ecytonucleospora hepatopenaei]|uniref:S1 motif domain-containing protein n=1 Tax=Ecytonucleospora hepatopenaei TaxID=646526 RepID=A0A1W0E2V2_9MICR|nr:hypothetical protein EHP00_2021 [Ecytonucleospora hepatopenaei]
MLSIGSIVDAIILRNGYQQVLLGIKYNICNDINHNNFMFKGILKSKHIDNHLTYNINDIIKCKVIGYKEEYIILTDINK